MRREGFELALSKPRIITKKVDGVLTEPLELAVIDAPEEFIGRDHRKNVGPAGQDDQDGQPRLRSGPAGVRDPNPGPDRLPIQFLTDTKGTGILTTLVIGRTPYAGEIAGRINGSLVSDRDGKAVAYAIFHLQPRGQIFVEPGDPSYPGLIVGQNSRREDIPVNITKEKKLTNIRAAASDEALRLTPPRRFTLEQAMEYINDDELVEVTPKSIRLRKKEVMKLGGARKKI